MGSIISAIEDDIEDYIERCKRMGEDVQLTKTEQGGQVAACYGKHARELRGREDDQRKAAKRGKG